jgi:hypothetical protein
MTIVEIKKFFIELAEVLVNVVPHFAVGFFIGFMLFSQLPFTWYNVALVLGLCFMSGIGYSTIVDIVKTSRRSKKTSFTIYD